MTTAPERARNPRCGFLRRDNDGRELTRRIAGNRRRGGHAVLWCNSFVPPAEIGFVVLTANWRGMSDSCRTYSYRRSIAPLSFDAVGTPAQPRPLRRFRQCCACLRLIPHRISVSCAFNCAALIFHMWQNRLLRGVHSVKLENVFRRIHTNSANFVPRTASFV